MDNRTFYLSALAFPFALGIPFAVWYTALGLEEGASSRFWVGLPLVVLGLLALESLNHFETVVRAESPKAESSVFVLNLIAIVLLQFLTVCQFFLMLDGHVHFRACCWMYFVYLVGVGVVLILHRGRASGWGARYLRSAWVLLLAFGVPLLLPAMKRAGLVPFSQIQ